MIWALHGFLGLPSDWRDYQKKWASHFHAVDLSSSQVSFVSWAKKFNANVREGGASENTLIGYSLGGRLALHALEEDPSLWQRVILLSTHPGLKSLADKRERLRNDEVWAQRFAKEDWETLMADWNGQGVFAQGEELEPRLEQNYRRDQLEHCLRDWSLGQQRDFRPLISRHVDKILWVTGELDPKFHRLAEELKNFCPALNWQVLPSTGHRCIPQALSYLSF